MFTSRTLQKRLVSSIRDVPSSVDVVVVGGGIVGTSTALHIAENSNKDVLVLEQNTLTSGTTWHAAGLITTSGDTEGILKIKEYTREMYKTFKDESTGASMVGWANTGSLLLARTPELWAQIIRTSFLLRQVGTISHELHEDPAHLHALLDTSKVLGALFLPDDGIVNPADVCLAVAHRARKAGAHILEHVEVTNFNRSSSGSIQSVVVNSESEIECDHVVLACGQWTSQLCRNHLSVHIPTAIVPHQYAIFDKIQGVDNTLPVIRDYASRTYMKPEVGSFAVGTFESPHSMMPAICASRNNGNLIPRDAQNELFDNVPMEKQGNGLEAAMELLPSIAEVGLKTCIHGPDTHSADHAPIVGFVGDTVPNLLVGTGFNSQGIQAGVGIGAVLADLICETRTIDEDVSFMDPRRFSPDVSADTTWCTERALEGYAETYGIHHPNVEFLSGRDRVLSSLHESLKERGAYFGSLSNGWERPQFFSPHKTKDDTLSYNIHKCAWLEHARTECQAARQGVAMFDMSSFGKLRVSGESATRVLEFCTSSMISTMNTGDVVYTQCLNRRGGVECDVTIMKESEDSYYVVTPSLTVNRDRDHIRRVASTIMNEDALCIEDITRDYSVLALAGPQVKSLFEEFDFPFTTARDIHFENNIVARTLRVSYVGEYGVEIHARRQDACRILEILEDRATQCNEGRGLVMGGYRAIMHSLRLEKGFFNFGHDTSPVDTQIESSLSFVSAAKLKTSTPFLGRDALIEQKSRGVRRRLVNFRVNDARATLWGHERVFRDGMDVGHITSGGISFLDEENSRAIGLGFVSCDEGECVTKSYLSQGKFHVEVVDVEHGKTRLVQCTPSLSCLYDPKGLKMR